MFTTNKYQWFPYGFAILCMACITGLPGAIEAQANVCEVQAVDTIAVGDFPTDVGVNPSTGLVYVANIADDVDGTVSVIQGTSVIDTIQVGDLPASIAVNPVTGLVYVVQELDNNVLVIEDRSVIATIPMRGHPSEIGLNPVTGLVYVVYGLSDRIDVIEGTTVTGNITVGIGPRDVGVNTVTGQVYVAHGFEDTVTIIEGIQVVDTIAMDRLSYGVDVSPVTGLAYVTNPFDDTVTVIEDDHVIDTIAVGDGPMGVTVSPATGMVYVVNRGGDTVSVIRDREVVETLDVGDFPERVGVNPNTGLVYVSNGYDDTVSIFRETCRTEKGWPLSWASMEIEAKWDTTEPTFNAIVNAFPEDGEKYGYDLNVRWSEKPRRFVDVYYDRPAGDLFNSLHALRHRQRSSSPDNVSPFDSVTELDDAQWNLNWEKVQYKSTPSRLDAVWFRNEKGGSQLLAAEVAATLACSANRPQPPDDDPIDLLWQDHPGFACQDATPVLNVVQYRYRIEFRDGGEDLYELSLDKVITTVPGEQPVFGYAVELEVLSDEDTELHIESRVDELFNLMANLESEFGRVDMLSQGPGLKRSDRSKGGLTVRDERGSRDGGGAGGGGNGGGGGTSRDFVAYNDMLAAGGGNASGVTAYAYGESGRLIDIETGTEVNVTMTAAISGPPVCDKPTPQTGGHASSGTDADAIFGGVVNLQGMHELEDEACEARITFRGLDPSKQYTITLTANRDNPSYANQRFTKVSLEGADSLRPASSAGVIVYSDRQVAFSTGDNGDNGYVAEWMQVTAADGSFSIVSQWDPDQGDGSRNNQGYAMAVFRLEQQDRGESVPWVAYNDMLDAGEANMANVTTYSYGEGGALTDFAAGSRLPVSMQSVIEGPQDICNKPTGQTGGAAAPGTDADREFGGVVNLQGMHELEDEACQARITFVGLDPNKQYTVALTANRDNSSYANQRFTLVTIEGADSLRPASSNGVAVYSDRQVSFSTGDNRANGYVAKWTDVTAADGSFSIISQWDPDQGNGSRNNQGYAMGAFLLEEQP